MIPGRKIDKHSTGGVGDKTSLILAPIAAACGVPVPMVSGRGLGHTGGTLDKLESIPGFRIDLDLDEYRRVLADCGLVLIGQTTEIAPADKRIYALRDATATVESIPLITASILSKKLAEGIDGLVLDVKTGDGAFMERLEDARALAESMCRIGRGLGKEIVALITRMDQPLGRAVGNAVEVAECVRVLRGEGPDDLRDLSVALAAEMLVLGGVAESLDEATARCFRAISDGSALDRFRRVVAAQGGDPRVVDDLLAAADPGGPPRRARARARASSPPPAPGRSAWRRCCSAPAGPGPRTPSTRPSASSCTRSSATRVAEGEPLCTVLARARGARPGRGPSRMIADAYAIGDGPVAVPDLIVERL